MRRTCKVTFTLKDGRKLVCFYSYYYTPATYWEPSECEVFAPEYELDGDPITVETAPRGLDRLMTAMYENQDDPRFKYEDEEDSGEPEDLGCYED